MEAGHVVGTRRALRGVRLGVGSPIRRERAIGHAVPLLLREVRVEAHR
jgi:hypothetical protein